MKFEVYKSEGKKEQVYRIALRQNGNEIELLVVGEDGVEIHHGCIGTLGHYGFRAMINLSPDVDIQRGMDGKVKCS